MRAAHEAEGKRVSERPVDEVMLLKTAEVAADGAPIFRPMELAPEMHEGIIAFLSPKQMGHVACVSRAWQAAVRAASLARLRVLQLELPYERHTFTFEPLTRLSCLLGWRSRRRRRRRSSSASRMKMPRSWKSLNPA